MSKEMSENPEPEIEKPVTKNEVNEYMNDIGKEISPLLREAVSSIEDADEKGLREIVDYFFEPRYNKPKGRPLLTRLSFETVADLMKQAEPSLENSPTLDPKIINNLLVAVRILDGASILHDDILDHDEIRDGAESVWKKYGKEKAILAGEIAHELANTVFLQAIKDHEKPYYELIDNSPDAPEILESGRVQLYSQPDSGVKVKKADDIHDKVIDIFHSIWREGCTGQRHDYDDFGKDKSPTLEDYEERMYLLTGQFHEKVMLLGAYAAGIDDEGERKEILDALGNYGKYYGIAAQLRNDLLDFAPPKKETSDGTVAGNKSFKYQDFVEGRQTMPIILAHEKCSPEEWNYIHERIGQKDLPDDEKSRINQTLVDHGIFKDCVKRIFKLSIAAIAELDKIPGKSRKKEMLRVWALAENNYIYTSFAGEDTAHDVKLDSFEQLEKYFSE